MRIDSYTEIRPTVMFVFKAIFVLILIGSCGPMKDISGKQSSVLPNKVYSPVPIFEVSKDSIPDKKDTSPKPTPTGLKLLERTATILTNQEQVKIAADIAAEQSRQAMVMYGKQDSTNRSIASLGLTVLNLTKELKATKEATQKIINQKDQEIRDLKEAKKASDAVSQTYDKIIKFLPFFAAALLLLVSAGSFNAGRRVERNAMTYR